MVTLSIVLTLVGRINRRPRKSVQRAVLVESDVVPRPEIGVEEVAVGGGRT